MPYSWKPFIARKQYLPSEVPSVPGERWEETFAEAYESLPFLPGGQLSRMLDRARAEGAVPRAGAPARISAAEANQLVRDAGITDIRKYEKSTTREAVALDIERAKVRAKRAEIFGRSNASTAESVGQFGLSIGTTFADPSALLNFVPVVSATKYGSMLSRASGLGRIGVRARVGAAEGAVGAAMLEPLQYGTRYYEHDDSYDLVDSFTNIAFGSIAGAGLHTVAGTTADAYRSMRGMPQPWESKMSVKDVLDAEKARPKTPQVADDVAASAEQAVVKALEEAPQSSRVRDDVSVLRTTAAKAGIDDMPSNARVYQADGGYSVAVQRGDVLQIVRAEVEEAKRGQGLGQRLIDEALDEAKKNDMRLVSDTKVSADQIRAYEALKRKGYDIEFNKNVVQEGADVVSADGRPVVEVKDFPPPKTAAERVHRATPEQREAALRTAADRLAAGEPVDVLAHYPDAPKQVANEHPAFSEANSKKADETINAYKEDADKVVEDAETEMKLAKAQAKQLGLSDAELKAIEEDAAKVESWANAAELAQICLIRGG